MKFEISDVRFFLNLDRRPDRREATEQFFRELNVSVERFPAIDGDKLRHHVGFMHGGRRAVAAGFKLMLKEAEKRGAERCMIFEDDLERHPHFSQLFDSLQLPEDWDLFYFGGMHYVEPEDIGGGMVKARKMVGNHAIMVRDRAFRKVRAIIRKPGGLYALDKDIRISYLQKTLNVYAPKVNLIWQKPDFSDLAKRQVRYFLSDGRQQNQPQPYNTPTR